MNAPSVDIANIMADESALGLAIGTDLFVSEMPATPDACVAVYDTGGYNPQPNYDYQRPTVQVRVRGAKGAYVTMHALAQLIRDLLNGSHDVTESGARYIGMWAEGDVLFLGYDDNHRPQASINFRLHRTTAS